ncbi:MAG TPA: 1-acyl-sn-glycerol-3-phosphate acyltransferase [Candidatus Microbacterium stercoravium]|uniref:1-acyl-sn-glycerol-3-phosphate acyltransferase n=1 Tax=Candidatus Microbacterium stercoravium TaxID=2838697 RepID=A0A9D2H5C9_9MICO|nr:1-acyl-sn-glycerol-3-phosphate acyltransferase [Candidatus Microbacterium stercoravium]
MFYWILKHVLVGPIVKGLFRPWISGAENVPKQGAAILASNHLSVMDSVFLPLMLERPMSFLAKSEYFTGKGIKGWATKWFMKGTGQIAIDRSGGSASEAALNTALQVVGRGDLLGIYPEGTRSPDGRMYKGRTGIARMALVSKVPVVPVVMVDTAEVLPIGSSRPRIMRVGIVIGEPLDFSRYEGLEDDRFVLRSVTDEIMIALQQIGGQEYVDEYASKHRALAEKAGATKQSSFA